MDRYPIRLFLVVLPLLMMVFAPDLNLPRAAAAQDPDITSQTPIPTGTSNWSMQADGVTRTFRLYVPESLDQSAPSPLVVVMHGGMGSARNAERGYGWDARAKASGFIVAYPDGLNRVWNAGNCCGKSQRNNIDDVGFITQMVDAIGARLSIDTSRIFAAGMSNGAMMAYRLACESDMFAAIGPVSGTVLVSCDHPAPVSVIHIHGLADPNVRFDGEKGAGVGKVDGMPIPDVISLWQAVDQCDPAESTTEVLVTTAIAQCANGRAVELITIEGGGHHYPRPDARPKDGESAAKAKAAKAIDATATLWAFFATHPKPAA